MRILLSLPLRSALLTAIFAISTYTLSSALGASVVIIPDDAATTSEAQNQLTKSTLTQLHEKDSVTTPISSGYTLTTSQFVPENSMEITKYIWNKDTQELTSLTYSVEIKPQGDKDNLTKEFRWDTTSEGITLLHESGLSTNVESDDFSTTKLHITDVDGQVYNRDYVAIATNETVSGSYKMTVNGSAVTHTEKNIQINLVGNYIGNNITGSIFLNSNDSSAVGGTAAGAAIYNTKQIGVVIGDFINNYVSAKATSWSNSYSKGYGGAIANNDHSTSKIESITGDFYGNTILTNTSTLIDNDDEIALCDAYGGAIYNLGDIGSITGDFNLNRAIAKTLGSADSKGGAIYHRSNIAIGSITGDFANNYAYSEGDLQALSSGGSIYYADAIANIAGNFIHNYAKAETKAFGRASGGAIFLSGTEKSGKTIVTGNFLFNSAQALSNNERIIDLLDDISTWAEGGAICNTSYLHELKADFTGNYTLSDTWSMTYANSHSYGGAIYNRLYIGDIAGNFSNNSAQAVIERFNGSALAGAGAASGGAIYNSSQIDSISGTFKGNYAHASGVTKIARENNVTYAHGGAITNSYNIDLISGDFTNNYAKSDSISTGTTHGVVTSIAHSKGGVIHNTGTIETVEGTFTTNYANATSYHIELSCNITLEAHGGVIVNERQINSISANFNGNYVESISQSTAEHTQTITSTITAFGGVMYNTDTIDTIKGNFSNNYAKAVGTDILDSSNITVKAHGGAIYNSGVINNITGDFIGNYAQYLVNSSRFFAISSGGAIFNNGGSIGLLALDSSMSFTGNHVKILDVYGVIIGISSDAIRNEGIEGDQAVVNFNAYNKHNITVNDTISGGTDIDHQILNINNGQNGSGGDILPAGATAEWGEVFFNSRIVYQSINVHAGTLSLGHFAGTTLDDGTSMSAQSSLLVDSKLKVEAGATVKTTASSLGNRNTITNSGTITISGNSILSSEIQLREGGKIIISDSTELSHSLQESISAQGQSNSIEGSGTLHGGSIKAESDSTLSINDITLNNISVYSEGNSHITLNSVSIDADVILGGLGNITITDGTFKSLTLQDNSLGRAVSTDFSIEGLELGNATLSNSIILDLSAYSMLNIAYGDTFTIEGMDASHSHGVNVLISTGDGLTHTLSNIGGTSYQIVPEPSTATLSLLALSALMLRRRRQLG